MLGVLINPTCGQEDGADVMKGTWFSKNVDGHLTGGYKVICSFPIQDCGHRSSVKLNLHPWVLNYDATYPASQIVWRNISFARK